YDLAKPLIVDPVLTYSTYFGGGDSEQAAGIAVDSQGSIYVIGNTSSGDFPTKNAIQPTYGGGSCGPSTPSSGSFPCRDVVGSTLEAPGTALVDSTCLGGSGEDFGFGVAVDSSGDAYVTGSTTWSNFPTTAGAFQNSLRGAQDAFVAKLNPVGSLIYSTYLG